MDPYRKALAFHLVHALVHHESLGSGMMQVAWRVYRRYLAGFSSVLLVSDKNARLGHRSRLCEKIATDLVPENGICLDCWH